ncbi:MAG: radical SAM family heme chaperone HemW [Pseudoruegeria sp.]
MEDWQNGGFGLYIHWPFCQSKCPYCDFNSHVAAKIDQAAWRDAYVSEIKRAGSEIGPRVLNTVFFGGGTPSLMQPNIVHDILDTIRRTWPQSNDFEVTLEANPSSVEAGRFLGYRDAGVSRISMGIQALNDTDLKRLGRLHTVKEGKDAFDIARKAFDRVSFDLIYARQDQTLTQWKSELSEALSMAIDHLSLYQLTIEDGTAFGDRYAAGKLSGIPIDDTAADMYSATQEICAAAGLPAYEVSNHAADSAQSRHNLIYWRYGDYLGIGPGAHGRITLQGAKLATETWKQPNRWLTEVQRNGSGEKSRETISSLDQAKEYLLMGLRLREGISKQRFKDLSGRPLSEGKINHLEEIGMVDSDPYILRATDDGRVVLNAILRTLIPD